MQKQNCIKKVIHRDFRRLQKIRSDFLRFSRKCRKMLQLLEISRFPFNFHHDYTGDLCNYFRLNFRFDVQFNFYRTAPPRGQESPRASCKRMRGWIDHPIAPTGFGRLIYDGENSLSATTIGDPAFFAKRKIHIGRSEYSIFSSAIHWSQHVCETVGLQKWKAAIVQWSMDTRAQRSPTYKICVPHVSYKSTKLVREKNMMSLTCGSTTKNYF